MDFNIHRICLIRHGLVRAVAEVDYAGLRLRGLKLEEHQGRLRLVPPGRRVQGSWQLVYQTLDPELQERLQLALEQAYRALRPAA